MEQRKNFLALILLDALDDENENDIFRILDQNGVDAGYVPQERGIAPLHYSCGMENKSLALAVTKKFLEAGADPNVRSEENMTPLHVAALNGRQEIVAMLLQYNAKLDVVDDERKTPVHYAIEECHFEVVQLMRDHIFSLKSKETQERLRKQQQEKALENSLLSESKFENSLQQRLAVGKTTSTPQKSPSVEKQKSLLAVPAPADDVSAKGTPQRVSYNYDVTSPYYIHITHRRHQIQPKFPYKDDPDRQDKPPEVDDDPAEEDEEEVINISSSSSDGSLASSPPPQIQRINIFTLTKENLEEFSRLTPEQHSTRLSLINTWRTKVQKTRARQSILKEFEDVNELVDEVMGSEHLNFSNTRLKEPVQIAEKTEEEDADSGACSSTTRSEKRRDTPSPPARTNRNTGALSLGQIIEKVAQAHLVDMDPPPKHTPSPPCLHAPETVGEEAESSYQTVPEAKPMVHLQVPQERYKASENAEADTSNFIRSPKSNEYFLQMTEAYVHTDDENGLVFYETKLLANQANAQERQASNQPKTPRRHAAALPNDQLDSTATSQSTNFTIPLDYETDALRAELTTFGEPPGPITKSTKRLYIKRLIKYKRKTPSLEEVRPEHNSAPPQQGKENRHEQKFSVELYRTLRSPEFFAKIKDFAKYDAESSAYFMNHQNKREMREGHLKQSFIYMLIDPSISCNLPGESVYMDKFDVWKRFLRSIFYVGKGKTSRPYSHLYDAMKTHSRMHNQELKLKENGKKISIKKQPLNVDIFKSPPPKSSDSKKLDRILEIWSNSRGVVCLHVFHNIVPVEAYTREAAIIEALSLRHLTNVKKGDYYGPAKTWTMKEKKYLGIVLLYKAMQIYLAEGESQLSPSDLI